METFQNKEFDLPVGEQVDKKNPTRNTTFADIVVSLMQSPPKNGWDTSSMRSALKIEDLFKPIQDKPEETVQIEDADLEYLKKQVENATYSIKHRGIIEFDEYVKSLPKK